VLHAPVQCKTVTRQKCFTVEVEVRVTTQVPQEQCYDRAEEVCVPVPPHTECTTVQEERRKEVPREKCKEVAREECKEVPREECKEVP
jgi:hypothetical protein